jgi:hypothetical protein
VTGVKHGEKRGRPSVGSDPVLQPIMLLDLPVKVRGSGDTILGSEGSGDTILVPGTPYLIIRGFGSGDTILNYSRVLVPGTPYLVPGTPYLIIRGFWFRGHHTWFRGHHT